MKRVSTRLDNSDNHFVQFALESASISIYHLMNKDYSGILETDGLMVPGGISAADPRAVFTNLIKIAEHLTIKLLENPTYLKSNFII